MKTIRKQINKAVKGAFSTTTELLQVELKDAAGKLAVATVAIGKQVLSLISQGMQQSTALEKFWHKNASVIVEEFFKAPPSSAPAAEMMTEFRASEEIGTMYAVFQTRHPDWKVAETYLREFKGMPESDATRKSKSAYNDLILTIRRTANNQAIKVCRYYAEEHKADAADTERKSPTARDLIEEVRDDWAAIIVAKRGNFKLAAESRLLSAAVEALRLVLQNATVAAAQQTGFLVLEKPVGRKAVAAAQKAGEVEILTPEAYAETQE